MDVNVNVNRSDATSWLPPCGVVVGWPRPPRCERCSFYFGCYLGSEFPLYLLMISSGKVIDAAVTQLDNRAGNATVIATVETTVAPSNGTPPKRNRFSATLARDGGSWKLSDLQQVAVNLS